MLKLPLKLKLKAETKAKVKAKAKVNAEAKAEANAKVKANASKAKFESQTRHNGGTPDQTQRGNCAEMALSFLKQNLKPGTPNATGEPGGLRGSNLLL